MPILSRFIKFLPALTLLAFLQGAGTEGVWAQEASPWAEGHRSRVRLVAGDLKAGSGLAGVQIDLEPGFKTYWRNPGESGLPPVFDWSASQNVAGVEVLWPAPTRFEEAGSISYGYTDSVVLPLRVKAIEPEKPVTLGLNIEYGVCKDICIPAQANLSLALSDQASPASLGRIESALARVPKTQPLGADAELSVLGAEPAGGAGRAHIEVRVRAPAGSGPNLFAEGPDNWFLLASPEPTKTGQDGRATFSVEVLERPRDAVGSIELRFTLVAGDHAVESAARLDAAALSR